MQVRVQRCRGGAPQEDAGCSGEKRREHPVQTQGPSGEGGICAFSLDLKPLRAAGRSRNKCVLCRAGAGGFEQRGYIEGMDPLVNPPVLSLLCCID